MKPIVIVESPYAGGIKRNVAYARAAVRDCILRGEAPYASHLLYTQPGVLRDENAEERKLGIEVGFQFRRVAAKTVVYTDLGTSRGMQLGIENAEEIGCPIEYRVMLDWKWEES